MKKADAIQKVYPLTPMQEGMLFHALMDSESSAYFTQMVATLHGDVRPEWFERSLNRVVEEFDILRTAFAHQNLQRPRQVVFHERPVKLHVEDLREMAGDEQERRIDAYNDDNRKRGFHLAKDVLLRVALFQLEDRSFRLVWSHHHILMDGWGFGVIIQRLFQVYADLRANRPVSAQTIYPFGDYVKWLEKRNKEQSLAYWESALAGFDTQTTLPGRKDGASASSGEYRQEQLEFVIDEATTEKLTRMARGCGATLNSLFQGVWAVLLAKYNRTGDVVFGSVVSGRPSEVPGIEQMVGLFINTVPVRVRMDGGMSFAQLAKSIQQSAVDTEAHSYLPLYEVQNRSELKQALLDHIIIFENYPLGKEVEGQSAEETIGFQTQVERVFEQTNYDLNVIVAPGEDLFVKLSYNANRFDSGVVSRVEGHLRTLIEQILDNPAVGIEELEIVTEAERQELIGRFNATSSDNGAPAALVHVLFEEQVRQTPDLPAVAAGSEQLTYRQLNESANRLARSLLDRGASGRVVAVIARRSARMAIALLAALKAGAAYLPIDPEAPADRIRFMLEDSGACLVLAENGLADDCGVPVIDLGSEQSFAADASELVSNAQPGDLAYIIYTSGTTGKPKGVMIEHRSIANTLLWRRKEYGFGPGDRTLVFLSFAFDAFVSTFFTPLLSGAAVVFAKDEEAKDPIALKRLIAAERITHVSTVPAMFQAILDAITPEEAQTLKVVTLGGESITEGVVAAARDIHPGLELVNEYGPTESSVITTFLRHAEQRESFTIGRPIANTEVWIVGADMRLQPVGAAGELCISGAGLARGYLNRPELTEAAFVPHPYKEGERLYRTGDVARWTADGEIEFVERIDHQVKIRGYRIELGEIEAALRKTASVKEAVVVAIVDGSGSKQLCAYVTGAGERVDEAELRSSLAADLPAYMIPAWFVKLDRLPLTANGKVDRKALPKPEGALAAQREYAAPATLLEAKLQPIWQEVLQVDAVGATDHFFELGGHSLRAMTLVTRLQKELQIDVSLKVLFDRPTIRDIARYIEGEPEEAGGFASIEPAEPRDTYPLSSGQRRMFVISRFENAGTAYNMPDAMLLEGPLDIERLGDALRKLIERHEPLRTSFELLGEEPVQRIHPTAELELELMEAADESGAERLIGEFIRPFDLGRAPLVRAGLVRLGEQKHVLLIDLHHIIADGVSIGVLIRDMAAIYAGEPLPELRIQYKDYAVWQAGADYAERLKEQEAYWLGLYADGVPAVDMPTDYPRPMVRSFEGARHEFTADAQLASQLRKLAAEQGATLFMLLFAAYNVLLSKYTGQEDFVVGTPIAGRSHDDVRDMAGMFVGTLALRSQPQPELAFRDYLAAVKQHCLDAFGRQDYPFEELVQKLGLARDMSRNPMFDTMFLMQNMEKAELSLDALKLSAFPQNNNIAKFDLTFGVIERDDGFLFSIEYATALYGAETAERLGRHYVQLLQAIAAAPERRLAELDMLDETEKSMLLSGYNDTKAGFPQDETIVSLFERQSELMPDRIAVSFDAVRLTYRELNERANVLAHKLREQAGVGRDDLVALLLDRSADIVVAMLAVLKAGGAYVPIDPAYPEDRIRFTLEDSAPKALLTASEHTGLAGGSGGVVLELDNPALFQGDTSNPAHVNEPNDLAYIIFTSGTTGRPKGVMITHRNVVRLLVNDRLQFDFNEGDVWTLFHSYCFDFSVWEMYGALLYGGQVVVVPRHVAQNPQDFADLLRREKVTVLNQTPTAFYALIHEEMQRQDSELAVRYVIFGGEALNPVMLKPYRGKYPQTKLINMYGITETTVHVTYKEITELEIETNVSNIGKPIPTLTCYIFDARGQLVPVGVTGELYVGGDGVARGYLNREELTAARFVQNPYNPEERLYRSGDLARRMASGEMEYLGRIDHQVKIRGHRIELGEIETVLLSHDRIRETTVIARDDAGGGKSLCAYFVAESELTVQELREFARGSLPDYMVPAHFVQLERIPLTSNGKIDRKALPEPTVGVATGAAYVAPQSIREQLLSDIWQEVLGAAQVGAEDNFFALGGDSIKAIQVAARLAAHGLKLEMKELFQYPTVGELAPRLKAASRSIDQAPVNGEAILTPIQHWFFEQRFTEAHHWNQSVMLYSPQPMKAEAVRAAFDAIVRHHDALRFVFRTGPDGAVTAYNRGPDDGTSYAYDFINLTGEADDRLALTRHAQKRQSSIDLAEGPLFVTVHYRTSGGDHLLMIAHHLIIDAVSWRVILEDLETAYGQAAAGERVALPLKSDSFVYWSQQLQNYASSPLLLREADYWRELESLGAKPLPRDGGQEGRGRFTDLRKAQFELSEAETELLLKQAGRAYNTEINDLLLTSLGLAVQEWAGLDHVCINLESHGREQIAEALDISRTVGWFTSQYPVVLDMTAFRQAEGGSEAALSRQIKETKEQLRAVPNKGIGYDILKYLTPAELKPAGLRFDLKPDICFNYLGQIDGDVTNPTFGMSDYNNGSPVSPEAENSYAWNVSGIVEDGRLLMTCDYNSLEFTQPSLERFMSVYRSKLEQVIAHCTGRGDAELTPSDISSKGMTMDEMDDIFDLLEEKLN
ncbi:amino acid adenylation domain-containing protein [Paenibacillus chartarius]|uniref:Amino acid adenylation domain-containing protein n=1 Tax=Paenibacillus chartarius TaxID=747481 RepID=A0ABV6DTB9_9BACL